MLPENEPNEFDIDPDEYDLFIRENHAREKLENSPLTVFQQSLAGCKDTNN